MLKTLRIRNLVTIEDLHCEFVPGLNVFTGETGAGKSIVVDALGLAAGERGDSGLVRSGAERAIVEAAFESDGRAVDELLAARGIDASDGEIIVRREIASSGSGRVLVNGSPATVSILREMGESLVELHSQHEQQGLSAPARHLDLLDAFGGHAPLRAAVSEAHGAVVEGEARLAALRASGAEGARRAEALAERAREIRGIDPKPGELQALGRERSILQNGARITELLAGAISRLDEGDDPVIAELHAAEKRVSELSTIDSDMTPLAARLASARLEVEDVRDSLCAYRDGIDFDAGRLEAIEARRAVIERLLLKWGPTEDDALAAAAAAEREVSTIEHLDEAVAAAESDLESARRRYLAAAATLTARRKEAATLLAPAVAAELKPLAFAKARFEVVLAPARGPAIESSGPSVPFHPTGAERAEFFLAPNPGEPAAPIGRAASGGELSRLMLALHVALEGTQPGRVLIFDEIDSGVSGNVAVAVGARLAKLSRRNQVLCVTHLPQVAAQADGHFEVVKRLAGGRTHTEIVPLAGNDRVEALAKMLGGRKPTAASRENAAELLREKELT